MSTLARKDLTRFWEKVDMSGDCWLWLAAVDTSGYGLFRCHKRLYKAHRFALAAVGSPPPVDKVVCHSCDQPLCVNPEHLWVGTRADNNADRDAKGRHVRLRGEEHGRAKLSEVDVARIRSEVGPHGAASRLAREYGVCLSTITRAASGRSWACV